MSKMSLKAYFPNLAETFQKANKGDIGALKLLNLDPGEHSTRLTKLAKIKKDTLKKDALKKEIASTIFEMEAAAWLGMSNIQLLYRDRQAYLTEMYELLYKERPIIGTRLKNMRLLEFMETLVQDNMEDIKFWTWAPIPWMWPWVKCGSLMHFICDCPS